MTTGVARDLVDALNAREDVARAVASVVCSTGARALPSDVVVSLGFRSHDFVNDANWDDSLTTEERRTVLRYVNACPEIFHAFASTVHVGTGGETRCSRFARGVAADVAERAAAFAKAHGARTMEDPDDLRGKETRDGGRGDGRGGAKDAGDRNGGKRAAPRAAPRAATPATPAPWLAASATRSSDVAEAKPTTSLKDIMASESRQSSRPILPTRADTRTRAAAPKLPVITAELLRRESRKSVMDKFGKVRCNVCGRTFKAYDALEQHIGASHYGLNNPEAKALETALIAAGLAPAGGDGKNRVSLKLGDLVSSTTKTSNSMVNSLAAYFKTEKQTSQRAEKKEGNIHGGQFVRSTNMASTSGMVLRRGVERRDGKKKKRSTLKKIILADRALRREAETDKNATADEVEVEVEVRVGWVYVVLEFVENEDVRVRLMCMEDGPNDKDGSSTDEGEDEDAERDDAGDGVSTKEKLEVIEARAPAGAWGVRSLADVLKGAEPKAPPKMKQEARTCEVCNVQCFGERAWEAHIAGKVHAKKLSFRHDPEAAKKAALSAKSSTAYVGTEGMENARHANQIITDELNEATTALLSTLKRFQDRLYHTDKIKAKQRRRLLYGLREVAKSVDAKTSKVVIIAPNIEKIESEGGLDDRIQAIIADAREKEVPVVFALTKRRIGKALNIQAVSIVSVLDYNGADEEYKKAVKLAAEGRALYIKHKQAKTVVEQPLAKQPAQLSLAAVEFIPIGAR